MGCEDKRSRSEANPAMGARDPIAVWGSCVARSGWPLESQESAVTPVPLLADLFLNRQAGVRHRLRALRLLGCRFGRWLEEIAGNVVNDALLADVATARRVSIRTHRHLPLIETAFPLLAESLPLYLECLYVSIESRLLLKISRFTCTFTKDIELQETIVDLYKTIVFIP